jgi:hypothetical protein
VSFRITVIDETGPRTYSGMGSPDAKLNELLQAAADEDRHVGVTVMVCHG